MQYKFKIIACILVLTLFSFAQRISNVQFKELDGTSYDLYKLLDKGHYVFIHMVFNR